ncbi:hypothetical protein [Evansella clarkii]|uniref:hypothetical protein n=1 Tax=Evansella clarkii TaxID=79879 RepID=UPI000996A1FC|nr:hypothetical protein [Evansella clarkii]
MNEIITILWPDLEMEVKARLLVDLNPELCQELKDTMPIKSIQSHAVVAGKQMYFPFRFLPMGKGYNFESMDKQPLGRINIELDFQYLSINYGPMTEPVPALAVAQVIEDDIPILLQVGEKVWNNLLFSEEYLLVKVLPGGVSNE